MYQAYHRMLLALIVMLLASTAGVSIAAAKAPNVCRGEKGSDQRNDDYLTGEAANGFRYVIERRPGPRTGLVLVVNAGTADGLSAQPEAAHVLEHIVMGMFAEKGSVLRQLRDSGYIATNNASTNLHNTQLRVNILRSDEHTPQKMAELIREWLGRLPISDQDVAREKSSVAIESRGLGAEHLSLMELEEKVFGAKTFATYKRSLGVQSLSAESVRDFYRTWYRPDLATVVIIGDVIPSLWRDTIVCEVGAISNPDGPSPRVGSERLSNAEANVLLGQKQPLIGVAVEEPRLARVHLISRSPTTGDSPRQELVAQMAAQAVQIAASRLSGASGAVYRVAEDAPNFAVRKGESIVPIPMVDGAADHEKLADQVARAFGQMLVFERHGVASADVKLAKIHLAGRLRADPDELWTRLGAYADMSWTGSIPRLPELEDNLRLIDSIRVSEVQTYVRSAFRAKSDLVIVPLAPAKILADSKLEAAIETGLSRARLVKVVAPEDRRVLDAIVKPVTKTFGYARASLRSLGTNSSQFMLPMGQNVIVRPMLKRRRSAGVAITLIGHASLPKASSAPYQIASAVGIQPTGLPRDLLREFLNARQISFGALLSRDASSFTASSPVSDLESLFQAARLLARAGQDHSEISLEGREGVIEAGADVIERAKSQVSRDILVPITSALQTLEPHTILVSGDISPEEVRRLTEKYLSDLPARRGSSNIDKAMSNSLKISGQSPDPASQYRSGLISNDVSSRLALKVAVRVLVNDLFMHWRTLGGYSANANVNFYNRESDRSRLVADVKLYADVSPELSKEFSKLSSKFWSGEKLETVSAEELIAAQTDIMKAIDRETSARVFNEQFVMDTGGGLSAEDALLDLYDEVGRLSLTDVRNVGASFFAARVLRNGRSGTDRVLQ